MKDLKGYAPKFGRDCSNEYVNSYKESHLKEPDCEYKKNYLPFLIVDSLYKNYDMLDVGCGTGGYYRLLKNYKSITGLDYSKKMLEAGADLAQKLSLENINWVCSSYKEYDTKKKFDIIRLGVYGTYEPHAKEVIEKSIGMLKKSGLLVLGIQTPQGLKDKLKIILKKEKIAITKRVIEKLLSNYNNVKIEFSFSEKKNLTIYIKKNA